MVSFLIVNNSTALGALCEPMIDKAKFVFFKKWFIIMVLWWLNKLQIIFELDIYLFSHIGFVQEHVNSNFFSS